MSWLFSKPFMGRLELLNGVYVCFIRASCRHNFFAPSVLRIDI